MLNSFYVLHCAHRPLHPCCFCNSPVYIVYICNLLVVFLRCTLRNIIIPSSYMVYTYIHSLYTYLNLLHTTTTTITTKNLHLTLTNSSIMMNNCTRRSSHTNCTNWATFVASPATFPSTIFRTYTHDTTTRYNVCIRVLFYTSISCANLWMLVHVK